MRAGEGKTVEPGRAETEGSRAPVGVLPRRTPLTSAERRRALYAGLAPIPAAVVVLLPLVVLGRASFRDVVGAALVYGGLLGLAAGFVYVDRVHARQCPRCGERSPRGTASCPVCSYDLVERPRYACDRRHELHLEPGICACGARLQPLPVARGIGREVVVMLKIGGWLLAFLLGVGFLLQLLERGR